MKKPEQETVTSVFRRWREKLRAHFTTPVTFVGDPKRVRKPGERDGDEEKLNDLNRSWREMLQGDPWMKKLMTHVRLLIFTMGIFFLTLWFSGLYLPAKHVFFNYLFACGLATIPYWLWVGGWYGRIERRVFQAFKKKFGKHHHLK